MVKTEVLKKVVTRVNGDYSTVKCLGGFNDSVYEVKINDEFYILKFYLESESEVSLIRGELDWITFLGENGIDVAKPVSIEDSVIGVESQYFYVLMEKVTGSFISDEGWDENLIQSWGQSMGRMHKLAKSYRRPQNGKVREWSELNIISEPPKTAADSVLKQWKRYISRVKSLPRSEDCFGIIHNDLHHQNLYFNNCKPVLFDFGDCEYGWFVYDIAISLYHSVQVVGQDNNERLIFARKFMKNFLMGYRLENSIEDNWLKEIGFFLNYRQIYSYLYLLKHMDTANMSEKLKEYLEGMRLRIENSTDYLEGFVVEDIE